MNTNESNGQRMAALVRMSNADLARLVARIAANAVTMETTMVLNEAVDRLRAYEAAAQAEAQAEVQAEVQRAETQAAKAAARKQRRIEQERKQFGYAAADTLEPVTKRYGIERSPLTETWRVVDMVTDNTVSTWKTKKTAVRKAQQAQTEKAWKQQAK